MKLFKRFIAYVLTIALVLSLGVTAYAADGLTLTVGGGTLEKGSSILIPISIENNPGIGSAELKLTYDADSLVLTHLEADRYYIDGTDELALMGRGNFVSNTNPDYATVSWAYERGISANGTLFWAVFETTDTVFDGDYEIGVVVGNASTMFTDTSNTAIPQDTVSVNVGTITVTGGIGVDDMTPVITAQSDDKTYYPDFDVSPLTVEYTLEYPGTVTYQWYSSTVDSNEGGTPVEGANDIEYEPVLDEFGTTYYYCVVTNFVNGKSYSDVSEAIAVTYKKIPLAGISVGISQPIKNESPTRQIFDILGFYTGTVTWTPTVEDTFAANTVYTAHAALVPGENYSFNSDIVVTVAGGEVTDLVVAEDGTMTFDVTFPATEDRVLEELTIKTMPSKTHYIATEEFDPTGLVLTARYDDGSVEDVTEGYDVVNTVLFEGIESVVVCFGGLRVQVPVTVEANDMTGIEVMGPDKTVYTVGEEADWTGLMVYACYEVGPRIPLEDGGYTITGFDSSKYDAEQTITVAVDGFADTFTITVNRIQTQLDDFDIDIPANAVYNGNPWVVTVTPKDGTLDYGTITVKYGGSTGTTAAPTAAGTYQISISSTETDTNTALGEVAINFMKIAPAELTNVTPDQTITMYNNGKGYELPTYTAGVVGPNALNVSYEILSGGNLITLDADAGTVTGKDAGEGTAKIKVTLSANNHTSVTRTITVNVVNKTDVSNDIVFGFSGDFAPMYDGNEFTMADFFNAATYNGRSEGITYQYNGQTYSSLSEIKGVNAGTYTVTACYSSDTAYGSKTLSITVDKAIAWIYDIPELTYTGQPQTGVADTEFYTVEGGSATDAGTYEATLTLRDPANYRWNDGCADASRTVSWTIGQATIDVSGYKWNYSDAFTYDGTEKSVILENVDSKLDVIYTGNTATGAGVYTAKADVSVKAGYANNYKVEGTVASTTWVINKATIDISGYTWNYDSFTYDGTAKTVALNGVDSKLDVVYNGNVATDAGTYTAGANVTVKADYDENYELEGAVQDLSWSIDKADARALTAEGSLRYSNIDEQSYTVADILDLLPDAGEITITDASAAANDILASAAIENGAVVYALKSGLTADNADDTAVITVTFTSTNYKDSTVTLTVKVMDKVDVSDRITFADGTAVYNGRKQSHETARYNGLASSSIRYEYSADPVNVGEYTVTAIYEDADNYGSKSVTFTITPATLTISGAEAADKTYDGTVAAEITGVRFSGVKGSDVVDYTVTSAAFADKNVGVNKAVSYTVALNGMTARNYVLASADGTAAAGITPRTVTVWVNADDTGLIYDGTEKKPAIEVGCNDLMPGDTLVKGTDYTVAYSSNINAGSGTVTVTAIAGSNYSFAAAQDSFAIGKAAAPVLGVVGVTAFKYTATGEYIVTITGVPADALGADFTLEGVTDAGNAVNCVTLADNGEVSITLNGMEAYIEGITVVIAVSVEMGNYETASVDVVLTFKDRDVPTAAAQDMHFTYTGEVLTNGDIKGSASVAGAWVWVTDPAELVNAGTYTAEVRFVPADSGNYAEVTDTITVTVSKADVAGAPEYTDIDEAGKTLADANLSVGTLTPAEGALVWLDAEGNPVTDPASVEVEDGVRYTWQYTPDNANYNVKTGTVVLWTSFVIPDIPVAPPAPTYEPVVEETEGGDVTVSPARPEEGDQVVITTEPDEGREVDEVIVVDEDGEPIAVTDNGDGTYTFTQPEGKVTVIVSYKCDGTVDCSSARFTDVSADLWYHEAVDYVVTHGLFKGTGDTTFSPLLTMTRGMLATVLHNLENNPQQELTGLFSDVPDGKYYSAAVEWAAARGIVEGYGDGAFGPNDALTREQLIVMLWRYAGRPESICSYDRFSDAADVSDWAETAMSWAVENGIINGKDEKTLDPRGAANRAQAAQILMNYLESLNK